MSGVAHFADAIDALVGVNADDGIVVVARNDGEAHICDAQIGWARIGVDAVFDAAYRFLFGTILHWSRHWGDSFLLMPAIFITGSGWGRYLSLLYAFAGERATCLTPREGALLVGTVLYP